MSTLVSGARFDQTDEGLASGIFSYRPKPNCSRYFSSMRSPPSEEFRLHGASYSELCTSISVPQREDIIFLYLW